MVGGQPAGTPGWVKWALIGAVLVIAALALLVIASPDPKLTSAPVTVIQPEKAAVKKPGSWSQKYSATFRYGTNAVTVDKVTVTGLKKKTATVAYRITVRNDEGRTAWIRKSSSWQLRGPDRKVFPASKSFSQVGALKAIHLTFRWPARSLTRIKKTSGASLQMLIPGESKTERVLLGLEVTAGQSGLVERRGLGGLTR